MAAKLLIGIPSKGRLKDAAADLFARSSLALRNKGHERRYRGAISGLDDVEVVYASAAEIVDQLKSGRVHLGVTGEDLIRETIGDVDGAVEFLAPLGFGRADVVVAVPDCWIDVVRMADLEDVAAQFAAVHGRRLRVATKYMNLDAPLLRGPRRRGLSHRRERGRDRSDARGRHRRADRRHHHDRHDAPRQSPESSRGRPDLEV